MNGQYADYMTQIGSLPELIKEATPQLAERHRLTLSTPDIYGLRQIVLTGSGDSYVAALAAAPAVRAWTGLPVQVMVSMEASRYVDAGVPPLAGRNRGMLVVAVSYSGEPARLVEATARLRRLGALTLALTSDPTSRLGRTAELVSDTGVQSSTPAPGTRSYMASLIALYLLGLRLAEVLRCMTMDQANALRAEIGRLSEAVAEAVTTSSDVVPRSIEGWEHIVAVDCLGSGPSYGSASFAAAKLVEATGLHATAQDGEEFHHLNYFVADIEAVPALLFAPMAALSATRINELRGTLVQLGRPHIVVTDEPGSKEPGEILRVPPVREWFAPMVHAASASVLAAELARRRSVVHYRGHKGPWRGAVGAGLVRDSLIELGGPAC